MDTTDDEQTVTLLPSTDARTLCDGFMKELKFGFLKALPDKVAKDDTLMISLRDASINLYYRGGSLMRLTRVSDGLYRAFFDPNYSETSIPNLPPQITNADQCDAWVSAIPTLKDIMNAFLVRHPKPEREFQQLVVWENNRSSVSNETEYFITDIEFASEARDARLDMLGLKWLAGDRKSGSRCKPVLIEMKWGDDAYEGNAGIIKHIRDIERILVSENGIAKIRKTISKQFDQLSELGLLRFNRSKAVKSIEMVENPEVVFILANHNPRSTKLLKILDSIKQPENYDLRFFVANFAGYGMHEACMLNIADFRKLVASFLK